MIRPTQLRVLPSLEALRHRRCETRRIRKISSDWYVLALSINEDRLRIYGLDRFENIEITKDHFKFPCDFNAKDYFSSFFGVVIDEDIPLQRIVVRAFGAHQHYMRSLPLHLSQKELCS